MRKHPVKGYFGGGMPFTRIGHGSRPLVVVQGLLFENKPQSTWVAQNYAFLGKEYSVYVVLRKPGMPAGYSLSDMAKDYARMIETEFGEAVDVIGVSTGGSIAHHLAAEHPGVVRRLVIHSSAYRLSQSARQLQWRLGELAEQRQWRAAYALIFNSVIPPNNPVLKWVMPLVFTVFAPLFALTAPKNPGDLLVTIKAEDVFDFKPRLADIRAPTLVIAGAQDPFYTPELFRETAEGIPQARLILYDQMGHPAGGKQFAKDVLAFLKET